MTISHFRRSVFAFAVALFSNQLLATDAHANMSVYPMAMSVGGEKNVPGLVRVYSKSDDIQYIKVQVKRVFHPGMPNEREEVAAGWNGKQIVVSPGKFALPAGASRAVRVINFAPPQKEEVYRVYFEAVAAPSDEPSLSTNDAKVSVSLVWGVLVRARPEIANPDIQLIDGRLVNTGNTRISVAEISRCANSSDESCTWRKIGKSVFPDASIALPSDMSGSSLGVKYELDGVVGTQTKIFALSK